MSEYLSYYVYVIIIAAIMFLVIFIESTTPLQLRLVGNTAPSEEERLTKEMLTVAQNLGNHYVKLQGNIIGQV